jgi:hypothetical protein
MDVTTQVTPVRNSVIAIICALIPTILTVSHLIAHIFQVVAFTSCDELKAI